MKDKRIFIDSIKDHLVPHFVELNISKVLYGSLVGFFESNNTSRKLTLRHQLYSVLLTQSYYVVFYIMIVSHLRDELRSITYSIFYA